MLATEPRVVGGRAELERWAWAMHERGFTYASLARALNEAGQPTLSGSATRWTGGTVRALVNNSPPRQPPPPAYAPIAHPPAHVIDHEPIRAAVVAHAKALARLRSAGNDRADVRAELARIREQLVAAVDEHADDYLDVLEQDLLERQLAYQRALDQLVAAADQIALAQALHRWLLTFPRSAWRVPRLAVADPRRPGSPYQLGELARVLAAAGAG